MRHITITFDMKHLAIRMGALKKATLLALATWSISLNLNAQGYYTKYCADKQLQKQAQAWLKKGEWRNGFTKADAHETVNAVEFYTQYKKNPEQWKKLFEWCQNTDLAALPKGRVPIPGTTMVASVEDDHNRDLRTLKPESHVRHIDFQYVVKGCERFGLVDHYSSKVSVPYRPDVVNYSYDASKAKFYDGDASKFFIFFPGDWHIAKVKTDKNDQNIRVVVIKVDYM